MQFGKSFAGSGASKPQALGSARTVPAYPPTPLHRGRRQVTGGEYCLCWLRERQGRPGSALGLWSAHVPWRVTAPQAGAGHVRAADRVYNPLVETGKHKRKYVIRKNERSGEIPKPREHGSTGFSRTHASESSAVKMAPNTITRWFEHRAAKLWRVPMGFEEATPKRKLPIAASSVSDPFSVEVGPIQSPWTPKGRS